MSKLWLVILTGAGIASAQSVDFGAIGGAGGFATSGPVVAAGQVGVEVCVFCSGHFGVFGEYGHWFTSGQARGFNASDIVRRADLAGGGLRIQGRGRIRPFVDLGLVGGRDLHGLIGRGGALGGAVVGAGVRIPLHGRWYIRPQVRTYGLSPHTLEGVDAHWAIGGMVGIGYSWK